MAYAMQAYSEKSQLVDNNKVGIFNILGITPNNRVARQNRGNLIKKDMGKIQKLTEIQPTIAFTQYDIYSEYSHSFSRSELGKLKQAMPLAAMAMRLGLKERSKGRRSFFPPEGKLALMVLKSYSGLSEYPPDQPIF